MKIKDKKKFAYRVFQIIMGIALAVILYLLASLASMPDWSGVQWTTYFLVVGISAGTGLTSWLAATLVGWSGRGEQ